MKIKWQQVKHAAASVASAVFVMSGVCVAISLAVMLGATAIWVCKELLA